MDADVGFAIVMACVAVALVIGVIIGFHVPIRLEAAESDDDGGMIMSMLSAQRDELRWLADNLEEHDSHMDEYVQAMRSAADTIWELRNKLCDVVDQQCEIDQLRAENAKLRDAMLSDAKKHALHHMDEDELRIWATQQAETIDGLRQLCKELYHRYWDVEGELFIDPDMDELTRRVRDFGIEAE